MKAKKTILSYRIGWSYVHDDRMEFHNSDLRRVPAGIGSGRTQDMAGQDVPKDPDAQQVIFFVAELTFSDGKRWTAKKKDVKYSAIESVSLASNNPALIRGVISLLCSMTSGQNV